MNKMIEYFQGDVKRINHSLKVFNFAQIISDDFLDKRTREIIDYASILHDIGIKEAERKYKSSIGKYQEIEGPPIAIRILTDLDISNGIINRVCWIIGNHHTYNRINCIDFQIVVEADLLVNIFEEGMSKEQIESIDEKIFKTKSGKKLIRSIYFEEDN